MIESQLKQVFIGDNAFKNQLGSFLNLESFSIVPEVQFINGITADFCVYDKNNLKITLV